MPVESRRKNDPMPRNALLVMPIRPSIAIPFFLEFPIYLLSILHEEESHNSQTSE